MLLEKYAKGSETTIDAVRRRVARALAEVEADPAAHEARFLKALEDGFIPGGRINSAAGSGIREVTLINCFVQPVGNSVSETVDGKPPASTSLSARRPRPCVAAAASATTSPRSARAAHT